MWISDFGLGTTVSTGNWRMYRKIKFKNWCFSFENMIFFKYNDTVIIDYDWRNLFMMILISNHKKVCWRDDIKSIKIFIYLIIIKPVSTSSYSYPGAGCGLRSLVVWTFTFSCSRQAARPGHRLVSSGFRPWNGEQHLTGRLKVACLCSLWTIQEFVGTQWFFCDFGFTQLIVLQVQETVAPWLPWAQD